MIKSRISNKSEEDILFDKEVRNHAELIIFMVIIVVIAEQIIKYSYFMEGILW